MTPEKQGPNRFNRGREKEAPWVAEYRKPGRKGTRRRNVSNSGVACGKIGEVERSPYVILEKKGGKLAGKG